MRGIGTIVNVLAVLAGGGIGLLLKGGMKQRYQDIMMQALGLATIFVGIVGTLQGMLVISDGALGSRGTLLMVLSLTIGGIVGEFLNIEHGLEQFGEWLKKKVHAEQNARFVEAFVTTSLVVCVGAHGGGRVSGRRTDHGPVRGRFGSDLRGRHQSAL